MLVAIGIDAWPDHVLQELCVCVSAFAFVCLGVRVCACRCGCVRVCLAVARQAGQSVCECECVSLLLAIHGTVLYQGYHQYQPHLLRYGALYVYCEA